MDKEILEILRKTYEVNGDALFADNVILKAYLTDLLVGYPAEKKRLILAVNENLVRKLIENKADSAKCALYSMILVDTYALPEEVAEEIIDVFYYAINGYRVSKRKVNSDGRTRNVQQEEMNKESKRILEERRKEELIARLEMAVAERKKKATEEKLKATEERQKATEERRKATEERQKATEERRKATEERQKAIEERQLARKWVNEQKLKEEQARITEENRLREKEKKSKALQESVTSSLMTCFLVGCIMFSNYMVPAESVAEAWLKCLGALGIPVIRIFVEMLSEEDEMKKKYIGRINLAIIIVVLGCFYCIEELYNNNIAIRTIVDFLRVFMS